MRLLSIATVNFKKLGTYAAEFTAGLNVIAGDNAKGKSTLLQAIECALFGPSVVPGKKENIPTWGQDKFSVTVRFDLGHHNTFYELIRSGTTAKLWRILRIQVGELKDPELVANGHTPVTAAVEELLGLAAKDWNLFVQSKQGESSGILTFGATALNRKVEEFAGVDLIEKVQGEAQRKHTLHSSYAEAKQVSQEELQGLETAVSETQKLVDAAVLRETEAMQAVADIPEFTMHQPAVSSSAARDQQRAVERMSNAVDLAESNLASAKKVAAAASDRASLLVLQDVDGMNEDLVQIHADGALVKDELTALRAAQAKHVAAQTEFTRCDAIFDGTNDAFQAEFREFDEVELLAERDHLDSDYIPSKQGDIDRESEEVGKAKANFDNLIMLSDGATCPTCNRAKEDHDPVKLAEEAAEAKKWLENRTAYVKQLKADMALLTGRRKAIVDQLAAFDAAAKKVDRATADLNEAKLALATAPDRADELKEAEESHEALRSQYAAKQQQIKGVDESNERFHAAQRELAAAETEVEVCTDALADASKALEEAPEPPTDEVIAQTEQFEREYREALTSWKEQKALAHSAVSAAEQNLNHQSDLLKIAEQRLAEALAKSEGAKEDAALAKKYGRLVQFLRAKRQDYMQEVWATVMGVSSKLVNQSSKGVITKLENVDGDFTFEEDGVMAPTSSASGAQKAFIGTSMRIGLGRALYGSDSLLIFDEPTESCSEHNAGSMAAMIASSAKQVLLITHRETDQALADNIINVGE